MLGKPEKEEEGGRDSMGKLTWKDADGASLAEFISEVQVNRDAHTPQSPPPEPRSRRHAKAAKPKYASHSETTSRARSSSRDQAPHRGGKGRNTACSSLVSLNDGAEDEVIRRRPASTGADAGSSGSSEHVHVHRRSASAAVDGSDEADQGLPTQSPLTPGYDQYIPITPTSLYYDSSTSHTAAAAAAAATAAATATTAVPSDALVSGTTPALQTDPEEPLSI